MASHKWKDFRKKVEPDFQAVERDSPFPSSQYEVDVPMTHLESEAAVLQWILSDPLTELL